MRFETVTMTERLNVLDDCRKIMATIFELIKSNPEYRYSINDQLIRSGLSIGSNISEANQRYGKDKIHLYNIALGSLEECRFQLSIYPDFKIDDLDDTFDKIRAIINKLKNLNHNPNSQS